MLWTPAGYYQASAGGEDLIGWHLDRGADKAPDFFPIARFRDRVYRPDVIARVLETGDPAEALRLADAARGKATKTMTAAELLPPTIEILSPAPGTSVAARPLGHHPHYRGRGASGWASGQSDLASPAATAKGSTEWLARLTIEVPPRDVTVELIAHNAQGASEVARFHVRWSGAADYYKPDLWVLAVGISDHPVAKARLDWAAKDTRDFVTCLRAQEGGFYKVVHFTPAPCAPPAPRGCWTPCPTRTVSPTS